MLVSSLRAMPVPVEALRAVPFLAGVEDRALAGLAGSMGEREVPAGHDLVTQGTGGIAFFVVLDGEASVSVDGVERRTLRPGDHFGEIALIAKDPPRTATVTAGTDVRVATLTSWNFKPFVLEHPEVAWSLLETLAKHIAETPGA
jgi:CRP/FNR family cyclic AMP-dependent transcriptional regulator